MRTLLGIFCIILVLGVGNNLSFGAVNGICSNCHTMHNSQDGNLEVASGAMEHLTKGGCVGCHTGAGIESAPLVDKGTYNLDTLAGGSFKATGADDNTIHNVGFEFHGYGTDSIFSGGLAPGATTGLNGNKGSVDADDLVCAGANGCHGDATILGNDLGISGFHHGSKEGWRFLQAAVDQGPIEGIGASDYEAGMSDGWVSGDEHNVYKSGEDGINILCANCHPGFHGFANTKSGEEWIRHPTDNTIPTVWSSSVDYRDNPFAFEDLTGKTSNGIYDASSAQVACVSCHRAHGTIYPDLLRWDYATQSAGGGNSFGCLGCHTKQR